MSSSSDEKPSRFVRPVTPPKPNILKQIRRSSTSQTVPLIKEPSLQTHTQTRSRRLWSNDMRSSKSEFNLSNIGRETPVKLRSNSSSSGSGLWATPPLPLIQNEGLDLSMTNPSTIPLTQELCQLVVNELNSISRYAVRILERSAETGNANMRQFLSENISKTCHSLQSSVTPTPALQGMHRNSDALVVPNQSNIPYNDSNYSLPPESMTQAMTLLQQYSDKLLNLVEQRITKKE